MAIATVLKTVFLGFVLLLQAASCETADDDNTIRCRKVEKLGIPYFDKLGLEMPVSKKQILNFLCLQNTELHPSCALTDRSLENLEKKIVQVEVRRNQRFKDSSEELFGVKCCNLKVCETSNDGTEDDDLDDESELNEKYIQQYSQGSYHLIADDLPEDIKIKFHTQEEFDNCTSALIKVFLFVSSAECVKDSSFSSPAEISAYIDFDFTQKSFKEAKLVSLKNALGANSGGALDFFPSLEQCELFLWRSIFVMRRMPFAFQAAKDKGTKYGNLLEYYNDGKIDFCKGLESDGTGSPDDKKNSTSMILFIILPIVILAVLAVLGIAYYFYRKKNREA